MARLSAVLLICWLGSATLLAADIAVTTLDDAVVEDGKCSLREAITNANHGSVVSPDCPSGTTGVTSIEFDSSELGPGGVIELNSPLPTIIADLQIQGFGHTSPGAIVMDGQDVWRIFDINGEVTVRLLDLQLRNGLTASAGMPGGALRIINGAEVQLIRANLFGNATQGGSSYGGAIAVIDSSLSLTDCELTENEVSAINTGGGAMYASASTISLDGTTIAGNRSAAGSGGGILLRNSSVLTAINSTVSENSSDKGGGGLYVDRSHATLTHTTVAFNSAGAWTQGIHLLGDDVEPAALVLENSLVVQSSSDQGTCGGSVDSITSIGSLGTHESCTGTATPVDDIGLRILAFNGGEVLTHGLAPDSVAVDAAGDCAADFGLSTDQRGNPRPGSGASACDVGAFEVQDDEPVTDLVITKTVSPESATAGGSVVFTLQADNLGPDMAFLVQVSDELPDGYELVSAMASDGDFDASAGLWKMDFLPAGISATLNIEAKVLADGGHVNAATITGGQFDDDPGNNSDQAAITLTEPEDYIFIDRFEGVVQ